MLVIERVGQFVDQGDAQVRRVRGAPHHHLPRLRVVVPQGADRQVLAEDLDRVHALGPEAERPERRRRVGQVLGILRQVRLEVGPGPLDVVLVVEQLDVDALPEHQPPLLFHHGLEVGDHGVELGLVDCVNRLGGRRRGGQGVGRRGRGIVATSPVEEEPADAEGDGHQRQRRNGGHQAPVGGLVGQ